MTTNASTAEKSIVDELTFGEKTAKRVGWESWEFTVEAPNNIRVTNASWGHQKDDHSYLVTIEEQDDGQLKPTECECKADQYRDDYDCKHKVSLASIGGPVVLQAATHTPARTDGGTTTTGPAGESIRLNKAEPRGCVNDKAGCPGPDADTVGCFACYRLPEDTRR